MERPEERKRLYSGFATTLWTVVITAGQGESSQAQAALEKLCRIYWQPLKSHVLREGYSVHDAEDLTQGFMAHLLEENALATVDRKKGRFRSFLLASLKHFLVDHRRRKNAAKRGGGQETLSLDQTVSAGEGPAAIQAIDPDTPDRAFDRDWALTVLARALGRLENEYTLNGNAQLFELLHSRISGESKVSYRKIATRVGKTEDAVKMDATRMRRRYQRIIREEVAHTVSDETEVEAELKELFRVFA